MKSVPNTTFPSEVIKYYYDHFKKWSRVYLRDRVLDPFNRKRRKMYKDLEGYKGSGRGKIAIVFANGPSVKSIDVLKLSRFCKVENAEVFCVNYFVNSDMAQKIDIAYWLISDPVSFMFKDERNRLALENAGKLVKKGIFTSSLYTDKLKGKTTLPILPFNDIETSHIYSKNIDPRYPRSYLSLSAYKMLAIAIYGGYEKIYISGFDNTFIKLLGCDRDNRIYRINEHFDSKAYSNTNRQFLDGKGRKVADEILAYSRMFSDLYRFAQYNIINWDVESLTDTFPKDDSQDIYIDSYRKINQI